MVRNLSTTKNWPASRNLALRPKAEKRTKRTHDAKRIRQLMAAGPPRRRRDGGGGRRAHGWWTAPHLARGLSRRSPGGGGGRKNLSVAAKNSAGRTIWAYTVPCFKPASSNVGRPMGARGPGVREARIALGLNNALRKWGVCLRPQTVDCWMKHLEKGPGPATSPPPPVPRPDSRPPLRCGQRGGKPTMCPFPWCLADWLQRKVAVTHFVYSQGPGALPKT